MWNIVLVAALVLSSAAQPEIEGDKERMDIITACWMLTIQDQAVHALQLEKILSMSQQRTKLFEKIQVVMVRKCFRTIPLKDAENVIDAITDATIVPVAYTDVVPDIDYEEFANAAYSLELDQFDQFLQTLIVDLEKNMGKLFQTSGYRDVRIFGMNSKTLILPVIVLLFALGGFFYHRSNQSNNNVKKRRRA